MLPPSTITEILEDTGGEVIRDKSRDLDLGVRSDLPSYISTDTLASSQVSRCTMGEKWAPFMKRASAA